MQTVLLAVDIILRSIIGPSGALEDFLAEARAGSVYFVISEFTLFCALSSVKDGDQVNFSRLTELLKYSQFETDCPEYLGPRERESWTPSAEEIQKWRKLALLTD